MAIPFSFGNPTPQTNPILITANTQASPGSWDAFPTLTTVNSVPVSAYLELQGTNGALLLNRLTTAQKNAVVTLVNGMILYDSTLDKFQFREAGSWQSFNISGPFFPDAGSAAAPAYSFSGDTDTGIYSSGANTLNYSVGGTGFTLPSSLPSIANTNVPITVNSTGLMVGTDYGQILHKVSTTFNDPQIDLIHNSLLLVDAPGAGKILKLHFAVLKLKNAGATYTGAGTAVGIQYGSTPNLGSIAASNTISANFFKGGTVSVVQSIEGIMPLSTNSALDNQALYIGANGVISSAAGITNTLIVDIWYSIINTNP